MVYLVFVACAGETHGAQSCSASARHFPGKSKVFHLGSRLQWEEAVLGLSGVCAKAAGLEFELLLRRSTTKRSLKSTADTENALEAMRKTSFVRIWKV